MNSLVGFPLGTVYQITNITNSNPGIVTLTTFSEPNSFEIDVGQTITISLVKGMNQINNGRFVIGSLDPVLFMFQLYDLFYKPVDTTNFVPYISGGEVNIFSYVPPVGQPAGLMYNNQKG